ncbi:thioredoxin reductase [Chlamydia trachomatis]|nr:thioredoxin reductase [Chlamydia trachomatis]
MQDKLKSLENVEVITSAMTTSIDGKDSVESLTYVDRKTDQKNTIDLQGVFILVGLVPNTEWIGEKLEKTKIGEIITKKDQSTNIEGVFASGDCSDQTYKQIVISIGSGATAALSAFNYLMRK